MEKEAVVSRESGWADSGRAAHCGVLREWVRSGFKGEYSAGSRVEGRLILESEVGGGRKIKNGHCGLQGVVMASRDELESGNIRWQVRPSDRELVNEVMNRLVVYLGGSEQTAALAKTAPQAAPGRADQNAWGGIAATCGRGAPPPGGPPTAPPAPAPAAPPVCRAAAASPSPPVWSTDIRFHCPANTRGGAGGKPPALPPPQPQSGASI